MRLWLIDGVTHVVAEKIAGAVFLATEKGHKFNCHVQPIANHVDWNGILRIVNSEEAEDIMDKNKS